MYILGINPGSHESSACLLQDGKIIAAAEEERFTRLKHATNQMPHYAVQFCLKRAGIELSDVDYVATCWNSPYQGENSIHVCTRNEVDKHIKYYRDQLFPKSHFDYKKLPSFAHVSHHLAHAASVYRTSPFDEGAMLIVDGQGDTVSTTLAHCVDQEINILTQFNISQSLGFFYQAVTQYLGLGWYGGEGKTMGLASYGIPEFDFPEMFLTSDGYRIEIPEPTQKTVAQEMVSCWLNNLEKQFGSRLQPKYMYDLNSGRINKKLLLNNFEQNLAASAQASLERILVHLAQIVIKSSGSTNLMLGGGVALNCSANEKILHNSEAQELFLFPACGDSGASVGAALELTYQLGGPPKTTFNMPFFGPEFSESDVADTLQEYGIPYVECSDPVEVAVDRLSRNQIVGWFQGQMELGPRALGHRSILANPANCQMRDHVNQRVKRRELWRPFSPALLEQSTSSLLGAHTSSPYMLRAIAVPDNVQSQIAATVHVDNTARLQTVTSESDPIFFDLISRLNKVVGVPAILNTSFNDNYEPIVCSPHDAIRTYFSTGIDVLIINNFLIDAKNTSNGTAI